MTREFLSVHDAHCCKKHGCKYGDDDCPVVLGTESGIFCEDCQYDKEVYPEKLLYLTGLTPKEFEQLKSDALTYRTLMKDKK